MTATSTDVRREITVATSPQRAFELFTNHMQEWWPAEHHVATASVVAMIVEPRVGGRLYDRCEDGSESAWGQVTQWDPPKGFAFAWMLTSTWQLETDVEKASRVSLSFSPEGEQTRVTVVHNEFERLSDGGQGMAEAVGAPDGWQLGLRRFAEFVAK
jgi:uncharacterized protein YndB with AHSA1/START domain